MSPVTIYPLSILFDSAYDFQAVAQLQVTSPLQRQQSASEDTAPPTDNIFAQGRLVTNIDQIAPGSLVYTHDRPPVPFVVLDINGDSVTVGDAHCRTSTFNFPQQHLIEVTFPFSSLSV
jgi:hypothetical protein